MSLWTQVEAMLFMSAGRPLPQKLQDKLKSSPGIFGKMLKTQQTRAAAMTMPTPPFRLQIRRTRQRNNVIRPIFRRITPSFRPITAR